jgi:hypothetical protein
LDTDIVERQFYILYSQKPKNSGKMEAGTPYEVKYTDTYGYVCVELKGQM